MFAVLIFAKLIKSVSEMSFVIEILYPLRWTGLFFLIHNYVLPLRRPKSLKTAKYAQFDNISISLIHSTVTAFASLFVLFQETGNASVIIPDKWYVIIAHVEK